MLVSLRDAPAVQLAVVVLLALSLAGLAMTDGHVPYTLDDPYIHLTLARNIAHGDYGINPGEPAAPSSSLAWPLLLAPFARSPRSVWVPLVVNSLCTLASVFWLERFFRQFASRLPACVLALSVAWSVNLFGLVFTGMEHSLQLLLVILVAVSLGGVPVPRWGLTTALIVLPWVRYESLAITLPVFVYLFVRDREARVRTVLALTGSLSVLVAFSLFLHTLGLDWLPSSIMAKHAVTAHGGLPDKLNDVAEAIGKNYDTLRPFVLAVGALVLLPGLRRIAPARVWLLAATTVVIMMFGRCGWFGRYEAHYVAYATVLIASVLRTPWSQSALDRAAWPAALLVLLVHPALWSCTLESPYAARSVHEQQYQLGTIVQKFLREPVAVNDLGLVAWLGGQPVLDLWGLGSHETLSARTSDPTGKWLERSVRAHDVGYAFIYPDWFVAIPADWVEVGELVLPHARSGVASDTVALFATTRARVPALRAALTAYGESSALASASLRLRPVD